MNEKTLKVLEYPLIIQKLSAHATSDIATRLIEELKPSDDYASVQHSLNETDEMTQIYNKHRVPGYSGLQDIKSLVRRSEIGSLLNVEELNQIKRNIQVQNRFKTFYASIVEEDEDILYPIIDEQVSRLPVLSELLNQINSSGNIVTSGLINSQNTHIIYSLFENLKKQIIFVTSSDLEAKKVYEDLNVYILDYIEYLGFEDVLFYHLDAKDRTQDAKKLKVLMRLINNENFVLVTSVEAILKKYIPKDILAKNIYDYKVSDTINIDEFNKKLVE